MLSTLSTGERILAGVSCKLAWLRTSVGLGIESGDPLQSDWLGVSWGVSVGRIKSGVPFKFAWLQVFLGFEAAVVLGIESGVVLWFGLGVSPGLEVSVGLGIESGVLL
jgi:hypothetical protein